MISLRASALAFALMSLASTTSAATLVNCGFETGGFTGWNIALTDNTANFLEQMIPSDTNQNAAASNVASFQVGQEVLGGQIGDISYSQTFSITIAGQYDFGVDIAASGVTGSNSDGRKFVLRTNALGLDVFASDQVHTGRTKGTTLTGSLDLGVGDHAQVRGN